MPSYLPKNDLVSISEAAQILGVSIDTIRRWDKSGTLHSTRADGKNRFFSLKELEDIKYTKPLSISQAVKQLGISQTTLRRLDKKGLIQAERNGNGERVYTKQALEKFLQSQYFLQQKQVEQQVLEPFEKPEKGQDQPEAAATRQKVIGAIQQQTSDEVSKLKNFKKSFYIAGLSIATGFVLLITLLTLLFLLFPENTAKFLGYNSTTKGSLTSANQINKQTVLGLSYPPPSAVQGSILGTALKPFSNLYRRRRIAQT